MDSVTLQTALTALIGHYGWAIVVFSVVLIFKKYIEAFVDGLMVFKGSDFDEEDIIFINGRLGHVTKHGLFKTKIYMEDTKSVLVILNRRLPMFQIEKYLPNSAFGKIKSDLKDKNK